MKLSNKDKTVLTGLFLWIIGVVVYVLFCDCSSDNIKPEQSPQDSIQTAEIKTLKTEVAEVVNEQGVLYRLNMTQLQFLERIENRQITPDTIPPYQDTLPPYQDTLPPFIDTTNITPIDTISGNDSYPKLGAFLWGNHDPQECAKFDLLITNGVSMGEKAKELNPNMKIIFTLDWQYGGNFITPPSSWYVRDTAGTVIPVYGVNYKLIDMTDHCPLVNGKRYNDYVSDFFLSKANPEKWDGWGTDGIAEDPRGSRTKKNVDLDRDKLNDYTQHGRNWITNTWTGANEKALQILRDKIGPDKLIYTNSSRLDEIGQTIVNGKFYEHVGAVQKSISYYQKQVDRLQANMPRPWICHYGANRAPAADDFRYLYFNWTRSMYADCFYFEFSDIGSGEHKYVHWVDDFDLELGLPLGEMFNLRDNIWVRYFEKGVAICYHSNGSDTIGAEELAGEYHWFDKGIHPKNDGSKFESYKFQGRNWASGIIGDGLILLK